MANLDRPGIFKARPVQWFVRTNENSQSVAVVIEYLITAQLVEGEWQSWENYEPHKCWGNHFVVKRDGKANVRTVQQLAESIGWGGSLKQVTDEMPPDCVVQVNVKANVYEGQTSYRVEWVNPEDYVPTGGGAEPDEVAKLDARFGSLLRAAAGSGSRPAAKPAPAPAPRQTTIAPPTPPAPKPEPPLDMSQIPF